MPSWQRLNSTRWNRKRAAALLNIDYKALLYKMKKLGLDDKPAPLPQVWEVPEQCHGRLRRLNCTDR